MEKIKRVTAPIREQVANILRQSITTGELVPGQRIIEREVCEATGASRTSVREALRQLESERLITSVPQHGTVVAVINDQEAVSLYETRSALEALLARTCAVRASDEELARVAAAIPAVRAAAEAGEPGRVASAAAELYDRIFEGAKNVVVEELIRMLHVRVLTLPITLPEPGRATTIAAELCAMAEAVVARDADAAAALASAHIASAGRHVFERFRASQSDLSATLLS